jgi:hypothetical protein
MESLEYKEDISLDQVFKENDYIIKNAAFHAIHQNYFKRNKDCVLVITIIIRYTVYSIRMSRNHYITTLEACIITFKETEEYEKCLIANEIIKNLKENLH